MSRLPHVPSGPTSQCIIILLCLLGRLLTVESFKSAGELRLSVSSALPIGAGLGSSASFGVALSAALLSAFEFPPLPIPSTTTSDSFIPAASFLSRAQLERVNALAFEAECVFHGTPSGIDNTVATFGGLVLFRRDPNTRAVSFEHHVLSAAAASRLRVLLVNTGVSRSTKVLVERVRALADGHPAVANSIFDAVDGIVDEARALLCAPASGPDPDSATSSSSSISCSTSESLAAVPQTLDSLDELVRMNQRLLAALSVSHPAVERIVGVCDSHGVAAKLTGAGGGGVVLAFLLTPAAAAVSDIDTAAAAPSKLEVAAGADGSHSLILERATGSAQPASAEWHAMRVELEQLGFTVLGPVELGGPGLQLRIES